MRPSTLYLLVSKGTLTHPFFAIVADNIVLEEGPVRVWKITGSMDEAESALLSLIRSSFRDGEPE